MFVFLNYDLRKHIQHIYVLTDYNVSPLTQVGGDIPTRVKRNAHELILDFIRSRPPLKPVSRFSFSFSKRVPQRVMRCVSRITHSSRRNPGKTSRCRRTRMHVRLLVLLSLIRRAHSVLNSFSSSGFGAQPPASSPPAAVPPRPGPG